MEKKRLACQVAYTKPTIENVIPYNRYKRTQPLVNGIPMINIPSNDLPILFGGGRDFLLGLLETKNEQTIENVQLFILNNGIILWFNQWNKGLEIPYDSVIYHGSIRVDQDEGHSLEMILTLERDITLNELFPIQQKLLPPPQPNEEHLLLQHTMSSIEFTLRPIYSIYDRHYNQEIETLFTFEDFGVNRGDDMVNNCNEAIATCLEQFNNEEEQNDYDDDEDDEDETNTYYTSINDTLDQLDNSGLADDLNAQFNVNVTAQQQCGNTEEEAQMSINLD